MFAEMTAAEAARLLGCSRWAIQKRALLEKWQYREITSAAGRKMKIYRLPEEIQNRLVAALVPCAREEGQMQRLENEELQRRERAVRGRPGARRLALAKGDFLRLYGKAAQEAATGRLRAKQEFLQAYNTGLLYPQIYQVLGAVSFATAERWHKALRETGDPLALAPRWGGKRGETVNPEAAKIMIAVALHPNALCISEVIRVARRLMAVRGVADGLSDRTYRRFLEEWRSRNYDYWTFYREGEKALHDKCLPYLERDYERIEVGDALVADGHRLNFEIINPWTGKPKRMTLILFYDFKSNHPCGWEIMPEENTQAIAAALRRAIICLGRPPLSVYLDNGKAFGGKYFSGKLEAAGFAGLFERLGSQVIFAWPYHAQSKTVERFFRSFGELERLLPSYTGSSIETKPPRLNRGEKLHRRLHEKLTGGRVITLEEAHRAIAIWFDDYARRPQRGHLKGRSPWEVFSEWRERVGHPTVNEAALRYLMMSAEVRSIGRNGVRFRGRNYYHPELYGRQHPVVIRYDEQDLSAIWVYEPSGELICQAEVVPGVHPLAKVKGEEADRRQLAEQIEQKKELLRQTTRTAREMVETVVGPEVRGQLEWLEIEGQGLQAREEGKGKREQGLQGPGVSGQGLVVSEKQKQAIEAEYRERQAELASELEAGEARRQSADWQRYERLLVAEARGAAVDLEDAVFMRYFENGAEYRTNTAYFETLRLEAVRRQRLERQHGDA